jgi:LL-diaminopimelate aminotransferase
VAYLNENYLKLQAGYLFPEIARRVREFSEQNPAAAKRLIRCGIGDVTEPLPPAAVEAMKAAVEELAHRETFRGYGPVQGYEFLCGTIAQKDYRDRGIEIADEEIFVSDGSKCDCGHILDILGTQNRIAITDPVYPVYVDTNVMAGHSGPALADGSYEGITYLPCTAENGFVPGPPREHVDLIYLCFPNNPTGAVATRAQLTRWVEYAREHEALLLFDAAYEAYINNPPQLEEEDMEGRAPASPRGGTEELRPPAKAATGNDPGSANKIPHSIFEIPGAREVAIEFRSFSKTGGFTGVRCGFTVMPKSVLAKTASGKKLPLHALWHRRWSTKSNSVSYPVQRGAEALYSRAGRKQVAGLIAHYMGNARLLREAARDAGFTVHGGAHAPYIWVETHGGKSSWETFDWMLRELNVVITPGSGFGSKGEGFFRVSAFNSRENAEEVARRLRSARSP